MVAQKLAESTELSLSGVFETEVKSLMSGALVHDLKAGIVLQNFEDGTVRLPEKFEPWCHDCSISSVLGLFARHSGKENGFRCLSGLKILDVEICGSRSFNRRLDLVSLGLRLSDFLFGKFNKFFQNQL